MKHRSVWGLAGFLGLLLALATLDLHAQDTATEVETGGDRVSISFTEASIQDVLRSLASMRDGVNIVVDPGITGQVSFQLEDVPWDTALQLVTDMHGLVVNREGPNIYRVSRPKAIVSSDLTVELHTAESVARLADDEARSLAGDTSLTAEEARAFLAADPTRYVLRIIADNQPAVDIVNELARQAALNFAFSADFEAATDKTGKPVTGKAAVLPPISLNLRNIGLEDAITLIAEQGKLSCVKRNNVWLVSPYQAQAAQLEPLKTETFTINYLPLDAELVKILKSLCTEREKVTMGKNKIILVRATADTIEAIRNTLLIMDRPTPQVLIEARIFQVTDGDISKLGIEWQDLGSEDGFKVSGTWDNLAQTDTNYTGTPGDWRNSWPNPPVPAGTWTANQVTTTLNGVQQKLDIKRGILDTVQYAYLDWDSFEFVLHALKQNDKAKQIANPKIVCNSDEQAFIHIGPQVPIIKSTTDGTGDTATRTYELDGDYGDEEIAEVDLGADAGTPKQKRSYTTNKGYLDLGTKLTVLPSVKTEEEVYLRVMPELVRKTKDIELTSGDNTVSYPEIFRTYVRTQFTLKSGQTVAIGGLIDESDREGESGIPLLKDIPWLGKYLFSYKTSSKQRSETVIFLTVKVIAGKELQTSAGVPVRSQGLQDEIDRIHQEDAYGAEYNEDKAREALEAAKAAEKAKVETRVNDAVKNFFGFGETEKADPLATPESYLKE